MYTLQVRKAGKDWLVTERGDDSPLGGPDRFGNHSMLFKTMADASSAAQWRIVALEDGIGHVERGPAW